MVDKAQITDLVNYIVDNSDYNNNEARYFLNIIINMFKFHLKNKDTIELRGLGTFIVKEHKAKRIQLKTKIIDSKNHFSILFKESSSLSNKINGIKEILINNI